MVELIPSMNHGGGGTYERYVGKVEKEVDENISWKKGSGSRIRFWEDKWIGNTPLMYRYPRLYSNAKLKQATLGEVR